MKSRLLRTRAVIERGERNSTTGGEAERQGSDVRGGHNILGQIGPK